MKRSLATWVVPFVVLYLAWMSGASLRATDEPYVVDADRQVIEVAICLDTSGSMQPLIDAARLKLWDIVNELTLLEPSPRLRVALLTYGGSKNDRKKGWVSVETPLTTDLDLVSERLFALETNGGEELVGRVLQAAVEQLDWTDSRDALKLVFVAGNESADQDTQVRASSMAIDADREDLVLHTIFCGSPKHPEAESWRELAETARGHFASIDQRSKALLVETPYDSELAELSKALNQTYIPLGEAGQAGVEAQLAQDGNALSMSPAAAATRAQTKAGPLYSQEWDLLDGLAAGTVDLYELDEAELPRAMREMTQGEREVYIDGLSERRAEIRQQILQLSAKRRSYVTEQVEQKGLDDSRTFDGVVRRAILEQVEQKGYRSEQP
jgi:hypothetical protein